MKNLLNSANKKKYLYILFLSLFIGTVAHGYRFMNNLYTHDALLDVVEDTLQYQRSLGRFMQTFTILLRGSICTPWIIGVIGIIFFSFTVFFITDLLEIENKISIALIAAISICNIAITTSAASFIPWFDVYAVALFFAVFGVWLFTRDKWWGYLGGCSSIVISLGFYQAYIDVALFMLLIVFMKTFRNSKKISVVWIKIAKTAGALVCSAGAYYGLYKLVCIIHHVPSTDSYNSMSTLEVSSGTTFGRLFIDAYKTFFNYLADTSGFYAKIGSHTDIWTILVLCATISTLVLVVAGIFVLLYSKRNHWSIYVIHIIGICAVPLFANFVYIISKGVLHVLMTYSFILIFIWAISLWEEASQLISKKIVKAGWIIAIALTMIYVWNNIVFSNQVYYRLDLQAKAFDSFATRMINDIENTDGYEYGKTQVVIYGNFESSPYIREMPYFNDVTAYGIGKTPITYMSTFTSYTTYYLNVYLIYTYSSDSSEEIKKMPSYPSAGSIVMDGDVLIIKISD